MIQEIKKEDLLETGKITAVIAQDIVNKVLDTLNPIAEMDKPFVVIALNGISKAVYDDMSAEQRNFADVLSHLFEQEDAWKLLKKSSDKEDPE